METPQALRLSILLLALAFCGAWWVEATRFNFILVQKVTNGPKGFKASNVVEFSVLSEDPAATDKGDDDVKDRHYQGPVQPPRNF